MNRNKDLTKLLLYVSDLMASIQSYLTSELLDRSGKVDNWSAKDNIFHSLVWSNNRLDMLETIERDENWTDVDYGDFSEINREIYEEHKNKSWDDLQLMIGTTYQRGLAYINRASEETLLEKKEGDERPFWRIVADNFVIHPMLHIWDLLHKSGRDDLMIENFGDDFSNMLRKLDTSEDWLGTIDYNQACLFSLSGNLEKAITKLGKALKLNSGLIDWSKQDSDLDPLRELPEFLELYKQ